MSNKAPTPKIAKKDKVNSEKNRMIKLISNKSK